MTQTLNATIAANVRDALGGRSLAELILGTGIPERTFRRRMQGNSAWTTDELAAVATYLDVTVTHLVRQPPSSRAA